ncbi:hypothetical protein CBS101457_005510 [Exobasidium rhododendri]|nr:hypothetical protein CBS101457_005510 [Exobasidium rhododendri]
MGSEPGWSASSSCKLSSLVKSATSAVVSTITRLKSSSAASSEGDRHRRKRCQNLHDSDESINWSIRCEAASDYLLARIPIPQYVVDYVFAYHERSSNAEDVRWEAALDLGCGPGQLATHLSTRFRHIYGRDTDEQMIQIARALPRMDRESLQRLGLPKPPLGCTFDYA